MYSTPLGSPTTVSKRSYVHVPGVTATGVLVHRGDGHEAGTGPGWEPGGYTGWVIPGSHRPAALLEESATPAKRAPEAPARGLEWVGVVLGRTVPCTQSCTTLRARSVWPRPALPVQAC